MRVSLSAFYGFNCLAVSPWHALLLEHHRPMVEARRAFDAKVRAGVAPGVAEVMDLARLETGSEDAAQEAGTAWAEALMGVRGGPAAQPEPRPEPAPAYRADGTPEGP